MNEKFSTAFGVFSVALKTRLQVTGLFIGQYLGTLEEEKTEKEILGDH